MSMNDMNEEFGSEIKRIANDLNNSLPMSKPQLRAAFTDKELKDLHVLLREVNEATSENEKIVRIQNNAESVFNLLKKLGVGL